MAPNVVKMAQNTKRPTTPKVFDLGSSSFRMMLTYPGAKNSWNRFLIIAQFFCYGPKYAPNGPKHWNLNYFKSTFLLLHGSSAHLIVDRPNFKLITTTDVTGKVFHDMILFSMQIQVLVPVCLELTFPDSCRRKRYRYLSIPNKSRVKIQIFGLGWFSAMIDRNVFKRQNIAISIFENP